MMGCVKPILSALPEKVNRVGLFDNQLAYHSEFGMARKSALNWILSGFLQGKHFRIALLDHCMQVNFRLRLDDPGVFGFPPVDERKRHRDGTLNDYFRRIETKVIRGNGHDLGVLRDLDRLTPTTLMVSMF